MFLLCCCETQKPSALGPFLCHPIALGLSSLGDISKTYPASSSRFIKT